MSRFFRRLLPWRDADTDDIDVWIGYAYLGNSERTKPAFLNSTGAM